MRMIVIENNIGELSVMEMVHPLSYYEARYNVLTIVNKLRNPYHVKRIMAYYKDIPIKKRKYQSRVHDVSTTRGFIAKVESLGYETIKGVFEEDVKETMARYLFGNGKEMVNVVFICKRRELVAYVGLDKLWVMRNDYVDFNLLSVKEKGQLMPLILTYIATEPSKR